MLGQLDPHEVLNIERMVDYRLEVCQQRQRDAIREAVGPRAVKRP